MRRMLRARSSSFRIIEIKEKFMGRGDSRKTRKMVRKRSQEKLKQRIKRAIEQAKKGGKKKKK